MEARIKIGELSSNGTVTVFQTIRPEFCPPFRFQTLKEALLSPLEALRGRPSLFLRK